MWGECKNVWSANDDAKIPSKSKTAEEYEEKQFSPSPEPSRLYLPRRNPSKMYRIINSTTKLNHKIDEPSPLTKSIAEACKETFPPNRITISVPNTQVIVILEPGMGKEDPDITVHNTASGKQTRISQFEHLFEYNFLRDWFFEFTNNAKAVLQLRSSESTITIITRSFIPTSVFQWNAFCGRLGCHAQSGNMTTDKDDEFVLPILILDENNLLRDSCMRQFNDFLRKEMKPYLSHWII